MSAFTYPGVYIQEISSGVHTITGVATSIAAFVGWANMGPTDQGGPGPKLDRFSGPVRRVDQQQRHAQLPRIRSKPVLR